MNGERPLLIFPRPARVDRETRRSGYQPPRLHKPSREQQARRLGPRLKALSRAAQREAIRCQEYVQGIELEQVLVLELISAIGFKGAARDAGMEWLMELEDTAEADEDFYHENDEEGDLTTHIYMLFTDQQARTQMLTLFDLFKDGQLPDEHSKWGKIFEHVKDCRLWDYRDRLEETGLLEDWRSRNIPQAQRVQCEAELWYRRDAAKRREAYRCLVRAVRAEEGQVLQACEVPEIAYQGALLQLPSGFAARLVDGERPDLVHQSQVMYFRPVGQGVSLQAAEGVQPLLGTPRPPEDVPGPPTVAILDGVPMSNHPLLRGAVEVHDPDNMEAGYSVAQMVHGTAVTSLVVNGCLEDREAKLTRRVLVRPILRPEQHPRASREAMPPDELPLDVFRRAVEEIVSLNSDGRASVKVINLAVADPFLPFLNRISPWARMLDWLAHKHGLLFIVSAGNHAHDIQLPMGEADFTRLSQPERHESVIRAVRGDLRNRTILSPAESVNALTVGSLQADSSTVPNGRRLVAPVPEGSFPSPVSALGLGYRRAVKPDLLARGGRQLCAEPLPGNPVKLICIDNSGPPGLRAASPHPQGGPGQRHFRGTSFAAALTTRAAATCLENLTALRTDLGVTQLEDEFLPVLVKALLVHSCGWPPHALKLACVGLDDSSWQHDKTTVARFFGYGVLAPGRTTACEDHRATAIGFGRLAEDEAHVFDFPLPDSLPPRVLRKRLVITLAWFTPIRPQNQKYRRAHLTLDIDAGPAGLDIGSRLEADEKLSRRGTVEHAVYEWEQADSFTADSTLQIKVNCRSDAGGFARIGPVPYGLAVTLETAEGIGIYARIRERIQEAVRVSATP